MPEPIAPTQAPRRESLRERLDPNTDPIIAASPRRRGYGFWLVSRMRDVRTILTEPATTVNLVAPKAIAREREQRAITADATLAILRVVARVHRKPNDSERLDAIAVTKKLQAALPDRDLRSPLAALTVRGAIAADAMAAVLRPILMQWRAAALGIDAGLGQKIEDGLLRLLLCIEEEGLGHFESTEHLARETAADLAACEAMRSQLRDMPIMHWISPAFLAIIPVAYTGVSMLAHLAENLDLQEELRARPELRPGYLREVERLLNAFRYATRQIGPGGLDLGDAWLPPRSLVVLDLAAANRDPQVWDAPDLWRLDRPPQPTAAFSFGPLACTGGQLSRQFLARLLDAALETARLSLPAPGATPDRIPARWSIARGYTMCRLRFEAL